MQEHQYLEDITFLVVEDNPFMRKIVMRILWAFGAKRVEEAADGIEFMKMVRDTEAAKNPFIPVIMLTGHAERHRIVTARNAGVNEYLLKPVSARALLSRVQAVIERPRQFVRTKTFFGPDRRRKDMQYQGDNRRGSGAIEDQADQRPPDEEMKQDEINKMFNPEEGEGEADAAPEAS